MTSLYMMSESLMEHAPEKAGPFFDDCVEIARGVGNQLLLGSAQVSATSLRGRGSRPAEALPGFRELILHWRSSGNTTTQWITLRNLVELLARLGAGESAALLFGAVLASPAPPPSAGPEAERLAAGTHALRESLGATVFDDCVLRGRCLGEASAIELALTAIDALERTSAMPGRREAQATEE